MNEDASAVRDHEWLAYYDRFSYFSPDAVRDGCHPRIREHAEPTGKAVVLVHGLSDSPYFMTAIADFFFTHLGHSVYLPLLHYHGLKDPGTMEGVKLEEWEKNVTFAIDAAAARGDEVSIGGLSTGGTLSFYMADRNPKVKGTLYLFSAALDLAGGQDGLLGELRERLLRTFLADLLDHFEDKKPMIGLNPYRYARIDKDGASELAELIRKTDRTLARYSAKNPFPRRVFAAHSESDTTADIAGIEALQRVCDPARFTFYRIPKAKDVAHASLVLKDPIFPIKPLEKKNPDFQAMMEALASR